VLVRQQDLTTHALLPRDREPKLYVDVIAIGSLRWVIANRLDRWIVSGRSEIAAGARLVARQFPGTARWSPSELAVEAGIFRRQLAGGYPANGRSVGEIDGLDSAARARNGRKRDSQS
jgi:hypothetical protein